MAGLPKKRSAPDEASCTILRLMQARDIVTELARYIAIVEKDPVKREDLYYKLIESLDFSPEWTRIASLKKLGVLYNDLAHGWWGDVPSKSENRYEGYDNEEL